MGWADGLHRFPMLLGQPRLLPVIAKRPGDTPNPIGTFQIFGHVKASQIPMSKPKVKA